jgi:dUTPase
MITALYKKIFTRAKDPSDADSQFIYDLSSAERTTISAGERKNIKTSLSVQIPEGYFGMILSKKDLYFKSGVTVFPEILTHGQFKEVSIIMTNINNPKEFFMRTDKERFFGERTKLDIFIGDKIAQIVVLPITKINWIEKI